MAAPTLNNSGQVVLQVQLADGVGDVGSHNDAALWFVDGAVRELLARKGAGDLERRSELLVVRCVLDRR